MGASNSWFQNLKQNRISQSIYTKLRGSSFQRKAPPPSPSRIQQDDVLHLYQLTENTRSILISTYFLDNNTS